MAAVIAGCGSAAPSTLHAPAATYLLTTDQLVAPDFTVDAPPQALSISGAAGGDAQRAAQLANAGFSGGASVDFFRDPGNIAEVNGPVQIGDTVEEFGTAAAAATIYGGDVARLGAVAGAVAVSTGALGDAAHATTRLLTDPGSGARLIEITVEWRVDNLIDVLVVRGRDGGTRPDDALLLAHSQTATELGLATPTPLPAATPTSRPS